MRVLVFLLAMLLAPVAARAETIMVNSSDGGLYLVDVETLAAEKVAQTPAFFDIAIDAKGVIYGVTASGQIWQVEPGGTHLPLAFLRHFVNALVFQPGGGMIGAGYDKVVAIAPDSGAVHLLGGFPGFRSSGDMEFGPGGVLYATGSPGPNETDTLFRMAPGGAMEAIGPIGFRNVYGLAWSRQHDTLFGVTEARELIVIDLATGAGRSLGVLPISGRGYGASGFGAGPAVIGALSVR